MSTAVTRSSVSLAAAALLLAGCSGASSPTAANELAKTEAAETLPTAAAGPTSILVEGVVTDASGRPLANAHLVCAGDVQCTGPAYQVIAEHRPAVSENTNSQGQFAVKVTSATGGAPSFVLNAHARGFETGFSGLRFPDGSCNADRSECRLSVSFSLRDLHD